MKIKRHNRVSSSGVDIHAIARLQGESQHVNFNLFLVFEKEKRKTIKKTENCKLTLEASHSLTDPSNEAVARWVEFGLKRTSVIIS